MFVAAAFVAAFWLARWRVGFVVTPIATPLLSFAAGMALDRLLSSSLSSSSPWAGSAPSCLGPPLPLLGDEAPFLRVTSDGGADAMRLRRPGEAWAFLLEDDDKAGTAQRAVLAWARALRLNSRHLRDCVLLVGTHGIALGGI